MVAFLPALEAYMKLKYFDMEKEKKHLQGCLEQRQCQPNKTI